MAKLSGTAAASGTTSATGAAEAPKVTEVLAAPRPKPTPEQHRAADPESSVWVSASAGTGKTRVLSNRMLRLLLHGNDPASILCLTYTKAGAAEMARRVQDDLARFATLPDEVLVEELDHLLGRLPHAEEVVRARDGLLQVLDLPSGLRIMTIHSFCQSLLRRFPLEAGVSPHFELMEPRAAATLLQHARDEVLISPNAALRKAVDRLAVALGESSLGEGLAALNARRGDVTRLLARHDGDVEALVGLVFSTLGVEPGTTMDRLRQAISVDPARDEPALMAAASALATGGDNDRQRGEVVTAWLQSDLTGRLQHFSDYEAVFLKTTDRQPKASKNVATKAVTSKFPHAWQALEAEQTRLLAAADREKAIGVAEKTAALLRVGAAIIQAYERRKLGEGKLDYTDLIDKSRALLHQTEAGDWVRYKLDQRIDHVLIDESQDTSPDQWAIVEALIDDFFSGDSARDKPPTLFVVGDEKQSIFGFQGADVETFQRLRRAFNERAAIAGLTFRDAPLDHSFRSAPAILEVVDTVFADPAIGAGVHSGEQAMKHQAFKEEALGLVEVWPLVEPEKKDEPEPGWALPDQAVFDEPVELRLARSIAEQIRRWLRDEAPLFNQDRPIEPKDIMILLPRRGVLQDRLVRELKRNNVPVAGADRLTLTDELAVRDLMALGDALLQPEDDLTVATVLRSPLFGLSDEELFTLAHDRGERPLYRRLADLRKMPAFAEADDRIQALLAKVDYVPPYDFFASFLCEGAPNGRQRLLRRLGPAAALPIEAFLAQAIAYERSHPPSMQGFLHWLRADSDAIKRDAQETRNEVRVLTVHGSKGLEAPIVFLADATYQKTLQKDRLLWRDDGLPLWKVGEKERDRQSVLLHEQQEARQQAEHRRLLYVAMTRAEERLIVAGCQRGGKGRGDKPGGLKNWYDMIVAGLGNLPGAVSAPLTLPTGQKGECWRFGDGSADRAALGQTSLSFSPSGRSSAPIPAWLADLARGEIRVEALRPSSEAAADDPPAASPLSDEDQRRFGRGLLIHRLLQILPGIENREAVLERYLAKPGFKLDEATQAEITGQVTAILDMPAWADLFGPRSRAEVPLVGEIGGQLINGQVDRLAVLDDRVIVLDYKTNRPPPRDPDDVPQPYCRQMAIYRALLREIYPDHQVQCALLWTEGPDLMILTDRQLGAFEPGPVALLDNASSEPTSS